MKSIRYRFFGTMHNLDDCLDFARKEKPLEVSVNLGFSLCNTETYIVEYMDGEYTWKFPSHEVKYWKSHGGRILYHSNQKIRKRDTDDANTRLENDIKKIEAAGIEVKGKEKKFSC